ncbi:hypothetical protein BT96DRAFT_942639 [Gymnopus androsaceus JB14]|uniref:Cytochrome P450 n=1 Tax=Gymnopus androsaceus JB14 TaxID=1447944 RepID=A0A6A4HCZ3_9AGAR|nr:hypothetical protein BT96DRAFT_942639 [Gymnopus androsaceus JB14]
MQSHFLLLAASLLVTLTIYHLIKAARWFFLGSGTPIKLRGPPNPSFLFGNLKETWFSANSDGVIHDSLPVRKDQPLIIAVLGVNTDKTLWGSDAYELDNVHTHTRCLEQPDDISGAARGLALAGASQSFEYELSILFGSGRENNTAQSGVNAKALIEL